MEYRKRSGYRDLRHSDEVEDLYDMVKNWDEEKEEQSFRTEWWEKEHIESIE